MNLTRFGELANTFETTKDRIENMSAADALAVRILAFYALAASILDMFEGYPELCQVDVTNKVRAVTAPTPDARITIEHETRVLAPEAGLNATTKPELHDDYVQRFVPFRLMGNGAFEITRDDPRVQRFLELDPTQSNAWTGIVAELAGEMNHKFGIVTPRHSLV
jgi:hypothetical protein